MAKQYPDKLSREAAMALAANMSYGKWKAMQKPVKIEPKKDKVGIETSICAYCGCEFIPSDNRNRKYCGARCRKLRNVEYASEKYYRQKTQTEE